LDGSGANDTRGAGHEYGLVGFKTASLEECKVSRLKTETQTNGVKKAESIGQPMTKSFRYCNLFYIAAILDIGEDTITGTKLPYVLPDRTHYAGDLLSRTKGQRR
jgi:hypothetical protein